MPDGHELKDAFTSISPIPYNELPPESELPDFLHKSYAHAETILLSIPDYANAPSNDASSSFTPAPTNSAKTSTDTYCDVSHVPGLRHPDYAQLQKLWGKNIKTSSNPLGVSCYKTAAHDRRGAWFCRRSLHQGLGFERWKRGMKREFSTSLKIHEGPGIGAVRGVSADRKLENRQIQDVGKIEG